ncbi:hypothetical protein CRENBAI_009734 [Crenichthys baileyi]|uniref:Uncharacterized protein n=1 Tax=Crenichthys baileyi TaxID=28760 RepID=A0AAV9R1V9_9TELE
MDKKECNFKNGSRQWNGQDQLFGSIEPVPGNLKDILRNKDFIYNRCNDFQDFKSEIVQKHKHQVAELLFKISNFSCESCLHLKVNNTFQAMQLKIQILQWHRKYC